MTPEEFEKLVERNLLALIIACAIILISFFIVVATVLGQQETCPQDNGWTKIDSDDLSEYPVAGATDYCFKAGSDKSKGCTGGIFDSWPQDEEVCGLSHWSYFIGESPTPTFIPCYECEPSPTPTEVPQTSTPIPTKFHKPTLTATPTDKSTPTTFHPSATPFHPSATPTVYFEPITPMEAPKGSKGGL